MRPIANTKRINDQNSIVILAIASVLFCVINCLSYFLDVDGEFVIPIFSAWVNMFFRLIPSVIFLLYIKKFYKNDYMAILIPIVLGLIALYPVFSFVLFQIRWGISFEFILNIPIFIIFALATYSAINGRPKKMRMITIAAICGLIVECLMFVYYVIDIIERLVDGSNFYIIDLVGLISELSCLISLYLALLFFSLRYKLPEIKKVTAGKRTEYDPERALRDLKNRFDNGLISKEEYQSQRAEIIRKI